MCVCVSANSCRRDKSGAPPVKSVRGNSNSAGRKCNRKHLLEKKKKKSVVYAEEREIMSEEGESCVREV